MFDPAYKPIRGFRGEYDFLSNFFPCRIRHSYTTVEHCFQAAKTFDQLEQYEILSAPSPVEAKRLGKAATLRADWEAVKVPIMEDLLREKFSNTALALRLLGTGKAELVEENTWGDRFWGTVNGEGRNELGKLLMSLRAEINEGK